MAAEIHFPRHGGYGRVPLRRRDSQREFFAGHSRRTGTIQPARGGRGETKASPGYAGLFIYRFRRGLHWQLADGLVAEKRLPSSNRPIGRGSSDFGRPRASNHPPPARVHQLPVTTLRLYSGHADTVVDRDAQPNPELADSCFARHSVVLFAGIPLQLLLRLGLRPCKFWGKPGFVE